MTDLGQSLLRYNKEQKYVIPDFETLNLNLAVGNLPWQVSWMIATKDEIFARYNFYLNWGKITISKDAARITGYDAGKIERDGRDPREIYQLFKEDIRDPQYKIVGHNLLNFDIFIEKLWCRAIGEDHDWGYKTRVYDTNAFAKALKKGIKLDNDNLYAWQFRILDIVEKGLKTNLQLLSKEYKIEIDPSRLHQSDYDTELTYEIFKKQIWQLDI